MLPRHLGFHGFAFCADDDPIAPDSADVVSHGGCEVKSRNPIGRTDLDHAARAACSAELIAELSLVPIERDQLVAPVIVKGLRCQTLTVAPGVQAGQQAFHQASCERNKRPVVATAFGVRSGCGECPPWVGNRNSNWDTTVDSNFDTGSRGCRNAIEPTRRVTRCRNSNRRWCPSLNCGAQPTVDT